MKIIKQSDYYDSVQAYGLDESIVYVRTQREVFEPELRSAMGLDAEVNGFADALLKKLATQEIETSKRWFMRRRYRSFSGELSFEFFIIGFCGKFFPCVRIEKFTPRSSHDFPSSANMKSMCFYPGDKVLIPGSFHKYKDEKGKEKDIKRIERFLKIEFKETDDIFHYFKAPIVAFNITDFYSLDMITARAVVNPLLSEFKFGRVKDAYSAFQDIAQYIAGVLGDLSEDMVSISDKDMRDAKGFDDWSFKTRPSKNKS